MSLDAELNCDRNAQRLWVRLRVKWLENEIVTNLRLGIESGMLGLSLFLTNWRTKLCARLANVVAFN